MLISRRLESLFIAFCLLVLVSCDRPELGTDQPIATAPVMGAQDCELDRHFWFPLDYTTSNGSSYGEYEMEIQTGVYYNTQCLCRVDKYEIKFSNLPEGTDVIARDMYGEEVNSTLIEPSGLGDETYTLIVHQFEELQDAHVSMYVDFDPDPGVLPFVQEAGGLCIVENYGGIGFPSNPLTQPIREQVDLFPPGSGYFDKIWIPTSIGIPVQ